ncbi:MAG: phosphosulfolactate synthase [Bacteroidota bacterium]|nr:phosphosulfolactate synthase [Bacteroidota bacterium]MDP4206314.1 phosphosulfolactate synthase [Bacteroidota bacterium]
MNFNLPFIPERPVKPRQKGLTMVMDKGLSLREAEDFISSSAEYVDLVKLGFGTGIVTPNLKEKIKLYKEAGLIPYFGGSLFEAFVLRSMFEEYRKFVLESGVELAEVSDGVLHMPSDIKCDFIRRLSSDLTIISEVGSKVKGEEISNEAWVASMKAELSAGSWKVIAEARESGNMGIYNSDGSANIDLINLIKENIDFNNVIWEAPDKKQQVWFIQQCGPNVNLGNIPPTEAIPLETLRIGLRGDTLLDYCPKFEF